MLVGVRLTPRAYVSPAAIHAPARRSVMPAVDWRRSLVHSDLFPSQGEWSWSGPWVMRVRTACMRAHSRAGIHSMAHQPAFSGGVFVAALTQAAGLGAFARYCICIRHRVRNLMFITVARSVGSRRGGLCLGSRISGGTDIAGHRGRTPEVLYVPHQCRRIYAGRISLASRFEL